MNSAENVRRCLLIRHLSHGEDSRLNRCPGSVDHYILSLNKLSPKDPPVEVILLSRNDPDTGLRVMKSIEHHGLPMTRAVFLQGRSPQNYIPALKISLFLSANETDVKQAMIAGYPAGQVLKTAAYDDPEDKELRIAFDFDGVIADDEAESIYQETRDLSDFHDHEQSLVNTPHSPGPLAEFLKKISTIQKLEQEQQENDPTYSPVLNISIVTARNAPSHERVINTMRHWNIRVNSAFFLGGIEKKSVLEVLSPHIFFDDQRLHLDPASSVLPSVHIPFGVANNIAKE
ncbi:5'-nucleotidase [Pseudomonas aeruginosa]|uniref:5'-nucleotidase n=8 Tax=Pseudomonas aeruginosa TaxID=287 RepID=UPI0009A32FCE|nr:5'-nucleotidase [Pseudomonas aeruginosa]MBG4029063.1 5'-nucleotidase [Pseudomonas aeruginosa]MBG4441344.1 5'-nucleotidase [Pseudomonas aeruginosa]MBG4444932.1 5'-nucleotidase [Pseudomonas aeruginosa]MBG4680476.1 5'-nucleotidase [Pseudomonas aeruginosa]MBG4950773.1 5'-nucleotidase [Pseudomonas aeruginosa]